MNHDPYLPVRTVIEDVTPETSNIATFTLRPSEPIAFKTGQFVEVTVPGVGEAPFTPSSSPQVEDKMEISVMKVGHVTSRLHELEPGDTVGVRGPYGVGYPLDAFEGKEVLISCDTIVLANLAPNKQLEYTKGEVYAVGDAVIPRRANAAIHDGYRLAMTF